MARTREGMADLVSTEIASLRKLSRDLEAYWKTKTAESSAIRDWRLRYRTWLRHTEANGQTKSEDDWLAAERARRDFNAFLRASWNKKLYIGDDDLASYASLIDYDPRYTDGIANAKAVFNRELEKWDDGYWEQLEAHERKREEDAQKLEDGVAEVAEGYRIAQAESREVKEDTYDILFYPVDNEIQRYAEMAADRASEYGEYGVVRADACTSDAKILAKKYLERGLREQAVSTLVDGIKAFIKEVEKTLGKDQWSPREYEPHLAFLEPHKAPAKGPDARLLDEMEKYTQGPYDAARGHLDDINALVQKVGYGCPAIEVPAKEAQENAEAAVLKDIEDIKAVMDAFGPQDHGHKREALIEPLRASLDGVLGTSSKRTQKRHIELFRAYASALEVWVRTAWVQFGGTPKGAKEAKYRQMASGK